MRPDEFLLVQDYLIAAFWPLILTWMMFFVAGGFFLALYHAMMTIFRERIL